MAPTSMKLVLLTPNADPTLDLGQELAAYASMLRPEVPDIEIGHAVIDRGPVRIETDDDVLAAAPEIVRKARSLVREGANAVIIDCMSEPGLSEAQRSVPIPVVGPRSAQGNFVEAVHAYTRRHAIAEHLAASEPANVEWQRDLILSHWGLAELLERIPNHRADAVTHWARALAVAHSLADSSRLAPADAHFVATLEQRLTTASRSGPTHEISR